MDLTREQIETMRGVLRKYWEDAGHSPEAPNALCDMALHARADAELDEEAKRLLAALNENRCGDGDCEEYRLEAAIKVLTGGKEHREIADKVSAHPLPSGMRLVPEELLRKLCDELYECGVVRDDEIRRTWRTNTAEGIWYRAKDLLAAAPEAK